MPFASGHIIGGYTSGKIFEKIKKIRIPHEAWFFIILGSLLPDSDFIIEWVFNINAHRLFTHSFLFVITISLATYIFFHLKKSQNKKIYALAIALGIASHLFLDFFSTQGIPLLYPYTSHFSMYGINYFDPATPSFLDQNINGLRTTLKFAVLDMALGAGFIFYLWWKKKIKF